MSKTPYIVCPLYCMVCKKYTDHEFMTIVSRNPLNKEMAILIEHTEDKFCLTCNTHRQTYFPIGMIVGTEVLNTNTGGR